MDCIITSNLVKKDKYKICPLSMNKRYILKVGRLSAQEFKSSWTTYVEFDGNIYS